MQLSYGLYMAEQEGFLNTRESAIQRIIKEVKDYPMFEMSNLVFYSICEANGIKSGTLTNEEMRRIEQAIRS